MSFFRFLSLLLAFVLSSIFVISNANNIIHTDCLSIATEIGCNAYPNICEWNVDALQCKFQYQDNDIIGARKIDLVFVADPDNIPKDMSLFLSSMIGKLYDRYDNKQTADLRCSIIPYLYELVSCSKLLKIGFIKQLFNNKMNKNKNIDLLSNFEDGIDLLFETNTEYDRDRDQYIIPNFDNNNHHNLADNLCTKLRELALFRMYPLLIQWKSFEYETNFDTNCRYLQHQPQFIHKINKYDRNKSIPKISSIVASKIHRNSLNPARFTSIDPDCVPFNLAAQGYAIRDAEIWYISGVVDIPTVNPTIDPTTDPTPDPTPDPTTDPTSDPTTDPSSDPSTDPTTDPTPDPTTDPTRYPTPAPTNWPSPAPTKWPTPYPTPKPTKWPTPTPTPWPTQWVTPKPTTRYAPKRPTWSTPKYKTAADRRKLQSSCSGGSGSYSGWVACTSMSTEQTTVINAQTADNTDQSVSSGYSSESLMSVFGSFDIYNIDNGDIIRNDIYMNNYKGCVLSDGNDEYYFQIGGYDMSTEYATSYLHIFDASKMLWYQGREMPKMNIPRYMHSCILVNNTFYVFGGINHVSDTNDPDTYYDSIEYFNFNPMMMENISIKQLLCLDEYDTDDCLIGAVADKMYEPKWEMVYTQIRYPRISAKLSIPSEYKMFLIGGYGYNDKTGKPGALQSIEIYDMKRNEILCNDMGPRLIIGRAAFSAGIYDDEYGYTCLHFIGGRTGVGNNFTRLPLLRSCEKMCFPTKIMNAYMDNMYDLFYINTDIDIKNNNNNNNNGNIQYNKWIIVGSIIIAFIVICGVMVIIRTRNHSKNNNEQHGINENTPLLVEVGVDNKEKLVI